MKTETETAICTGVKSRVCLILLLAWAGTVRADIVATGGNMSDGSGYRIHTFTNSDTFTVTSGGNVDVLLVAGGGGGGGGAGGLIYSNAFFDHSGVYPTFASQWLGSTIPTNYQVRCYVPRGDTSWASFAATSVTPLTTTETNSFRANYPAETLPVGTWVTTGGRKQWYSTWVAAAA